MNSLPSMNSTIQFMSLARQGIAVDIIESDPHVRYTIYTSLLETNSLEKINQILHLVSNDPDLPLREATLGKCVDHAANILKLQENFDQWINDNRNSLSRTKYPFKHAHEWSIFKKISSGIQIEPEKYLQASDWLQRKLTKETSSIEVLTNLASCGRTKRIRTLSSQRMQHDF